MATAFFRTVILYLLLIAGLRITGKRQIGELEPIELVLTMLLSDLASVPMQDFGIPLVNGIVPIVTLLSLSMLLSYGSLRSVRFRTLLCGEPTLIIRNEDQPGSISIVSAVLANLGINIATFHVNRSSRGGQAIMVIECDSPVSQGTVNSIAAMQGIISAAAVDTD